MSEIYTAVVTANNYAALYRNGDLVAYRESLDAMEQYVPHATDVKLLKCPNLYGWVDAGKDIPETLTELKAMFDVRESHLYPQEV